jgi:hypothetical protein
MESSVFVLSVVLSRAQVPVQAQSAPVEQGSTGYGLGGVALVGALDEVGRNVVRLDGRTTGGCGEAG